MRAFLLICAISVLGGWGGMAVAGEAVPTENDPVAQKRAVELAAKLRCLVCQNQSIAESDAELAVDLRRQVREQIAAGKSDREIINFMTERYGDFVLYEPPMKPATLLLWIGPLLLLAAGVAAMVFLLRGRGQAAAGSAPLTEAEQARATALLEGRTIQNVSSGKGK
ncbi:MAG: cytochrome c-type biogenesis protein CcmH [Proteobacteria bacterium]|nr:cytochrome c-type biogenesis protein CcmH [Pseudomonadota bacterium]MCL2308094.1 cytochrome c-type biogenesis protein CcmH [Pseudomonadota bacterium]